MYRIDDSLVVSRLVLFCALLTISFGSLADVHRSSIMLVQTDTFRQQQLAVLRAQLQQASDELALNRSAQTNPGVTENQLRRLQARDQELQEEIAALRVQEEALKQEMAALRHDAAPVH